MPLITRDGNLLKKSLTQIENTTPNILGLQNQINELDVTRRLTDVYVDTVDGDNNNDGLSENTPLKDLEAVEKKFPLRGQWYVHLKGSGDPTNKRNVYVSDLYPTYITEYYGRHFLGVGITVYDQNVHDVNLILSRNGNGTGLWQWWFLLGRLITLDFLTLMVKDSVTCVIYNTIFRLWNSDIINDSSYSPIKLLQDGIFAMEGSGLKAVLNTSANLVDVRTGTVDIIGATLVDNYAAANGLTARTWTTATDGIVRDASGTVTNVTSNVIK